MLYLNENHLKDLSKQPPNLNISFAKTNAYLSITSQYKLLKTNLFDTLGQLDHPLI